MWITFNFVLALFMRHASLGSADDGVTRVSMSQAARLVLRVAFAAFVVAGACLPALAQETRQGPRQDPPQDVRQDPPQDTRQDQPGQFDFYVLSLSWSPSFCAAAAERSEGRPASTQCGPRPYAFVVHGLWPQYDKGFPEYCEQPAPRLDRGLVATMLDLMPAPPLIFNEWDKHGTCAGLAPRAYFETVRKARAAVKIPPDYLDLKEQLSVAPAAVADAFIKANSGLTQGGIAVACDGKRLTEVRLCLSKDLQFRDCPEIAKRSCGRDQVVMPPVRGG
jgi:ribonuclease T2